MKEEADKKQQEKQEKHDAMMKKMEEHKKTMGLRIRNVGTRKSIS